MQNILKILKSTKRIFAKLIALMNFGISLSRNSSTLTYKFSESSFGTFQATLSKLLTYTACSGQLSLLPAAGREMSSSLWAIWCEGLWAALWIQLFASEARDGCLMRCGLRVSMYHFLIPITSHFQENKALLVTRSARASKTTFLLDV